VVQPEWLDALPAADPKAVGARGDLQRLNRLMGHAAILRHQLARTFAERPPRCVVELGAGDGTFLLRVAESLPPQWTPVQATLVDRTRTAERTTLERFNTLGWRVDVVEADVFEWLSAARGAPADVMIANLFLHHFSAADLKRLFELVAGWTRHFVACEPRRTRTAFAASRLLGLIGCNRVTRHDAPVSVRAGFRGRELAEMWPLGGRWELRERPAAAFSHLFIAAQINTVSPDGP
jgi:hypothetical protein